jgi:curved DNA-binding protein CbpA
MQSDPNGLYAELGVSPTASIQEIKSAYRALVKIYHPDINKIHVAVEKFKRITAAYEVLTDERKRAEYDRGTPVEEFKPGQPHQRQATREPVEPVHCSKCGKVTAQPRYLAFRIVRSFILVTHTKIRHGIYCSDCALKEAFAASAISTVLGWWGFSLGSNFNY